MKMNLNLDALSISDAYSIKDIVARVRGTLKTVKRKITNMPKKRASQSIVIAKRTRQELGNVRFLASVASIPCGDGSHKKLQEIVFCDLEAFENLLSSYEESMYWLSKVNRIVISATGRLDDLHFQLAAHLNNLAKRSPASEQFVKNLSNIVYHQENGSFDRTTVRTTVRGIMKKSLTRHRPFE